MSDSEEFHDLASAADYFHSHSTQSQNESEPKGRERALTSEDMRLVSSGLVSQGLHTRTHTHTHKCILILHRVTGKREWTCTGRGVHDRATGGARLGSRHRAQQAYFPPTHTRRVRHSLTHTCTHNLAHFENSLCLFLCLCHCFFSSLSISLCLSFLLFVIRENMGITVERKSAKPVSLFRVIGILNADIQTVFDLVCY